MARSRFFILAVGFCSSSALPSYSTAIQPEHTVDAEQEQFDKKSLCDTKCQKHLGVKDVVCLFGPHHAQQFMEIIAICSKQCTKVPSKSLPGTPDYVPSKSNPNAILGNDDDDDDENSLDKDPDYMSDKALKQFPQKNSKTRKDKPHLSTKYCRKACNRNIGVVDAIPVFGEWDDAAPRVLKKILSACMRLCKQVNADQLPGNKGYVPPAKGALAGLNVTCDDGDTIGDVSPINNLQPQPSPAPESEARTARLF